MLFACIRRVIRIRTSAFAVYFFLMVPKRLYYVIVIARVMCFIYYTQLDGS